MTDKEIIQALKKRSVILCSKCKVERTNLCNDCISEIQRNALALINRQQAEIEKLNIRLRKEQHQFADIGKMYSEIRAEAIKEFARKLLALIGSVEISNLDLRRHINNLVKEMVGEQE